MIDDWKSEKRGETLSARPGALAGRPRYVHEMPDVLAERIGEHGLE
jgi:hypothetical protein